MTNRYLNEKAINQVENTLLDLKNVCDLERKNAIKEDKKASEIKLLEDMQCVYNILLQHLESVKIIA